MIKEIIKEAYDLGKLDLTLRDYSAYLESSGNSLLRQYFERKKEEAPRLRPSSWSCGRKRAAEMHGVPGDSSLPFDTVSRFWLGDTVETWFATLARAAGVGLFGALGDQYTISTPLGDGHPDGFLQEDLAKFLLGEADELWENKGGSAFGWSKFDAIPDGSSVIEIDDAFGYCTQVSAYGHSALDLGILKKPQVRFTYISMEDSYQKGCKALDVSEKLLFLDENTQRLLDSRALEADQIKYSLETNGSPWDLPPLPLEVRMKGSPFVDKLPITCSYCPVRNPCWEAQGKTLLPLRKGWRVDG